MAPIKLPWFHLKYFNDAYVFVCSARHEHIRAVQSLLKKLGIQLCFRRFFIIIILDL